MKIGGLKGEKDKLWKKAEKIKDTAVEQADQAKVAAAEKFDALMESLDETLVNVKALGLTLKDFELGGGIVPSASVTLQGSVNAVDPARLGKMIDDHPDNEILLTTLRLLQRSVEYKDRLSVFDLKGIELGIKAALPPNVSIRFI